MPRIGGHDAGNTSRYADNTSSTKGRLQRENNSLSRVRKREDTVRHTEHLFSDRDLEHDESGDHTGEDDAKNKEWNPGSASGHLLKVRRTTDESDDDSHVSLHPPSITSNRSGRLHDVHDDSSDDTQEGDKARHPITLTNARGVRPYSGLALAASRLLKSQVFDDLLRDDLAWQQRTSEARDSKRFRGEVMTHSGLVVLGFMRPGSPFIHLLHCPQTYTTHRTNDDLNHRDIGFVGDRTDANPTPTPVVLADKTTWGWVQKPFTLSTAPLITFYADPKNRKKLWVPPTTAKRAKNTASLPRLILLPNAFIPFCTSAPRTPWDLHDGISAYIADDKSTITAEECTLILDWCLAASHADQGNVSWLAYQVEAAFPNNDNFHHWVQKRLVSLLGDLPSAQQPHQAKQPDNNWNEVAQQLRSGIVEGLRSTDTRRPTIAEATASSTMGKEYDDQQVFMLMGLSHATSESTLQPVWASFQATKNSDAHRLELGAYMRTWATKHQVTIVHNMELSDKQMGYIMKMQFNPPGCNGATYYSSIDKGLTILTCRPPEGEEIEALLIREIHEQQTVATRTLADLLGVASVGKTKPAEDYNELKLNLGTFCALLWTLFGSRCDYYKKCFLLWTALDDDTVFANRRYFSPLLCRQMTWAVIEDGRRYFSKVMTERHFAVLEEGDDIIFPRSHLDSVADSAYTQTAITRPSFPTEWSVGWLAGAAKGKGAWAPTYADTQTAPAKNAMNIPRQVNQTAATVVSGLTTAAASRRTPRITGVRKTDIHPGIKTLMTAHLRQSPFIQLRKVLSHSNMTIDDLPTLPDYIRNGTNGLCYNYILGHCTSKYCNYKEGHAPASKITNEFARTMISKLEGPLAMFSTPAAVAARASSSKE